VTAAGTQNVKLRVKFIWGSINMRRTVWSPFFVCDIYCFHLVFVFHHLQFRYNWDPVSPVWGVLYTIDSKTIRISAGHIVTDLWQDQFNLAFNRVCTINSNLLSIVLNNLLPWCFFLAHEFHDALKTRELK
jgi:hypothetical protein